MLRSSRDFNPGRATHLRAPSALDEVNSLKCPRINGVDVEAASELGHAPGERVVVEAAPSGVRHVALRDTCISLPTRHSFRERLDGELARSKPPGRVRALFCLDLDGFTAINDACGSGTGDELLQIAKERSVVMTHRQLQGRCFRLMRELATAYGSVPLQSAWIDRLASDLADTECEVAALRPVDDRRSGPLPATFGRDKVALSSAMPSLHST